MSAKDIPETLRHLASEYELRGQFSEDSIKSARQIFDLKRAGLPANTMLRQDWDKLTPMAQREHFAKGGKLVDKLPDYDQ